MTAVVRACLVALLALVGALLPVPGAVAAGTGSLPVLVLSRAGAVLPGETWVALVDMDASDCTHHQGPPDQKLDAQGRTTFDDLAPGTYRLEAWRSEGGAPRWWVDADDCTTAADIVVTAGANREISMAMGPVGTITGSVLGPDGRPVAGVMAQAYTIDPASTYRRSGVTDETGTYTIANVQPGTYKVEFRDLSGRLAGEFWNDTLTLQTATDVTVAADEKTVLGATTLALPVSISQPGPDLPGAGTGTGTAAVITVAQRPRIVGRTRVGRTLRVRPGTWSPAAVNLTYQWFARGVAIERATTSTLRLTRALRGKRIQVQVTASRIGSMPVMAASPRTTRVEPRR